jgi:hypothetical protein
MLYPYQGGPVSPALGHPCRELEAPVMNEIYEEIEIPENSSGYAHKGNLFMRNLEVGIDRALVIIGTRGQAGKEYDLRVGHPITHEGGKYGKFEIHLVAARDGDLSANRPASAVLKIKRL